MQKVDEQVSQREQNGEELLAACRQFPIWGSSPERSRVGTQYSDERPLAVVLRARPSFFNQVVLLRSHAQVGTVRLDARGHSVGFTGGGFGG